MPIKIQEAHESTRSTAHLVHYPSKSTAFFCLPLYFTSSAKPLATGIPLKAKAGFSQQAPYHQRLLLAWHCAEHRAPQYFSAHRMPSPTPRRKRCAAYKVVACSNRGATSISGLSFGNPSIRYTESPSLFHQGHGPKRSKASSWDMQKKYFRNKVKKKTRSCECCRWSANVCALEPEKYPTLVRKHFLSSNQDIMPILREIVKISKEFNPSFSRYSISTTDNQPCGVPSSAKNSGFKQAKV
jgi:hypothetical protein